MIDKVKIRKVAIFNTDGIELNLKKINYIFGSNGTGKTTISEFLRNNNDQRFSSCEINWERDNNFDIFVYNKHFVEENLTLHNELKGIFTLGKESSDRCKRQVLLDKFRQIILDTFRHFYPRIVLRFFMR